jgi:hypothetical protein
MDPIDETIEALILSGAIEISGIDSVTHQPLYSFNSKIQEIMPELYREHLNEVNREIMRLWEQGFLDVDLLSEDPLVTLTDKAFDDVEIEKISREEQIALIEIKRLLLK